MLSAGLVLPSYALDSEEEQLYKQQSVLIYKFISYFTWPQTVYLSNNVKSITVCIFGKDNLGKTLDQLAAASQEKDKIKITIKRGVENSAGCNIAYIADSQKADYEKILSEIGKQPVLTVSEIQGFAQKNGVLEFTVKRGKLKFEINKAAANKQGLKISPDLLELAVNVIE